MRILEFKINKYNIFHCTRITCMLIIACRLYVYRTRICPSDCKNAHEYTRARIIPRPIYRPAGRKLLGLVERFAFWLMPCFAAPAIAVWRWRFSYLAVGRLYFSDCDYISTIAVRSSVGYSAAEHQQFYMRHELRYVSGVPIYSPQSW